MFEALNFDAMAKDEQYSYRNPCDRTDKCAKQTFASGAQRESDKGKYRPDLISPVLITRLGHHLRKGAENHADRNWEKGIPNNRAMASLMRHTNEYRDGDRSEDHLAAIVFNAMVIMHNEEMIKRGILDKDLDDMPNYSSRTREVVG